MIIKSFNGIGDLLFATPSFRVIKEAYPDCYLEVNSNRWSLLENNPFIDKIGHKDSGVFLLYPAPDGGKLPTQHHILTDWQIICQTYGLETKKPQLRPELFLKNLPPKKNVIGVQVNHKRNYHNKRVWPCFDELAKQEGFEPIPQITSGDKMQGLAKQVASYKCVVCAEGGISHLAAALHIPAVVLFGGFSDPIWTGYNDHLNIVSDVECKHCFNLNPCRKGFICWENISVNYVIENVRQYLSRCA